MCKKIAKFYFVSIFGAAMFYWTIGAIPGWFVSESESVIGCCIVSVLAYILLLWCTKLLIKDIFQNTEIEKTDIWRILLPYFIAVDIFILLFCINICKDMLPLNETVYGIIDDGIFKFGLAFVLPVSYSVIMLWGVSNYSYFVFYCAAILFSVLHMIAIKVLFIQQVKQNASVKRGEE